MSEENENEDDKIENMFSDFDSASIEMDVATQALKSIYVGLRQHGLGRMDAALIVAAVVKLGGVEEDGSEDA